MMSPLRLIVSCGVASVLALGIRPALAADPIPYPGSGTYNNTSYAFNAAATGHVVAYFVGGTGAGYTNEMGLLVNGVMTPAGFGLNNHATAIGTAFDLGQVNAGDSLVFVLNNISLGKIAYSDPSMNVAYDDAGVAGHNHIYAAPYTATSPVFPGVPQGVYVAFEDLVFPNSDFNYDDESFVFTNVAPPTTVPEPGTLALLATVFLPGLAAVRRRRTAR